MTIFCVYLILTIFYFQRIESLCVNILSKEETQCARSLNLDETSVLEFYQTNSDDLKFEKYLSCVWLKWNYVNEDGVILYSNIIKSNDLPWQMLRLCQDEYMEHMKTDFEETVKYCKLNRPDYESPLAVRKCIHNNYKATSVR